jgi:hypothetical protein
MNADTGRKPSLSYRFLVAVCFVKKCFLTLQRQLRLLLPVADDYLYGIKQLVKHYRLR